MWIRSLWWDGLWLLSGLPIGLLLTQLGQPSLYAVFYVIAAMEVGHAFAPTVLAWSHPDYRSLMLANKRKHIWLPALVAGITVAIGALSSLQLLPYRPDVRLFDQLSYLDSLLNPWLALIWGYLVWNAYHFAMQNFGVLSLYRARSGIGTRWIDKAYCLTVTSLGMSVILPAGIIHWLRAHGPSGWSYMHWGCLAVALGAGLTMLAHEWWSGWCWPRLWLILSESLGLVLVWWNPLVGMGIYSINHWLSAIGLAGLSFTKRHKLWGFEFPTAMLLLGCLAFFLNVPTKLPNGNVILLALTLPWLYSLRLAQGMTHLLYDRWVYKLSDPRVRTIIGQDLIKA